MTTAEQIQAAGDKARAWRKDPVLFVREVFRVEPDAWQKRALRLCVLHMSVAMKACKGPGKSCVLAWIVWWFLATRLHAKVIATSVSSDNLKDGLWTELAKWQKESKFLTDDFTWSAEKIAQNQHPETWYAAARTWSRSANVNQQGQTLAGKHADRILFVIDEAGSVPDAVAVTAEAALANASVEEGREALLVIAGNPDMTSGPLYRACTRERDKWGVIEVTGDPNDPERSPRVSKQWAQDQIDKYGAENPWVLVNVFGKFPPQQANKLFSPDAVAAAQRFHLREDSYSWAPKILGVDVARYGDDRTVLCIRQGRVVHRFITRRHNDVTQVGDLVAVTLQQEQIDACFVDAGGVGAGVIDYLGNLGFSPMAVDFGGAPSDAKFQNKRAEMWWNCYDWFKQGVVLPADPEIVAELCEPEFSYGNRPGKFSLESKDDLKARGVSSPDMADALCLTFASPVSPVAAGLGIASHQPGRALTEYDPVWVERA